MIWDWWWDSDKTRWKKIRQDKLIRLTRPGRRLFESRKIR